MFCQFQFNTIMLISRRTNVKLNLNLKSHAPFEVRRPFYMCGASVVLPVGQLSVTDAGICTRHWLALKQLSSRIYQKIISYNFFKISLQIYIIVVRNIKPTTFLLWKQTIHISAIGIFLLYITATALITH